VFLPLAEGIVAAFTVPLFLAVLGNRDLGAVLAADSVQPAHVYVLVQTFGFALIAAVSAKPFLDRMSVNLLALGERIVRVERQAERSSTKIEDIADQVIEPEAPEAVAEASAPENPDELRLLRSLADGMPARSIRGLSISIDKPDDQVEIMLGSLQARGLVKDVETYRGRRWSITSLGQRAVGKPLVGKRAREG